LQLKKILRANDENSDNKKEILSPTGSNWQQFGYPEPKSDVTSLIEMKRKQTVVVPLRGGGGKNKSNPVPDTSSAPFNKPDQIVGATMNGLEPKKNNFSNDVKNRPVGIVDVDFFADVMSNSHSIPTDGPAPSQEPAFMKQISRHGRRDSGHLLNRTSTDNQGW